MIAHDDGNISTDPGAYHRGYYPGCRDWAAVPIQRAASLSFRGIPLARRYIRLR